MIFGHLGRPAGNGGVLLFDLGRRIAGSDPVVDLLGGEEVPLGIVVAEGDLADGRVVHQEAITLVGDIERNRSLGVDLPQVQHAAL